MNDSKRRRLIRETLAFLAEADKLVPSAVRGMRDGMNGWPAGVSYETDRSTGHATVLDDAGVSMPAVSDPTGEAAIRPDPAARDMEWMDRTIDSMHKQAKNLHLLSRRYQNRPATEKERRDTMGDADNARGCELCAELMVAPGVRRWEPVWKTLRVDDKLVPVCRWCGSFIRDTGRVPSRGELEAHHRGERVSRPA